MFVRVDCIHQFWEGQWEKCNGRCVKNYLSFQPVPIPSGAPIPSVREDSTKSCKSRIIHGKMELWICTNGVLGHINACINQKEHKLGPLST